MNTKDLALDARLFCLFKGDPGAGKSIAAGSFPKPYFFDLDARIEAVVNYWRPRGREFEYDRNMTVPEILNKLQGFKSYCPFETLVFDGITSAADDLISAMIGTRDAGKKKVVRGGIELAQVEDYGGESRGLTQILSDLRYISLVHNVHVIVTAHVLTTESKDIKTKVVSVSRQLLTAGKKVAAKLPKDFNEAYHFDVQSPLEVDAMPQYTCITRHVGEDWAKTALPLPIRLNFTDGSLFDIIMDELSKYDYIKPIQHSAEPLPDADVLGNIQRSSDKNAFVVQDF